MEISRVGGDNPALAMGEADSYEIRIVDLFSLAIEVVHQLCQMPRTGLGLREES